MNPLHGPALQATHAHAMALPIDEDACFTASLAWKCATFEDLAVLAGATLRPSEFTEHYVETYSSTAESGAVFVADITRQFSVIDAIHVTVSADDRSHKPADGSVSLVRGDDCGTVCLCVDAAKPCCLATFIEVLYPVTDPATDPRREQMRVFRWSGFLPTCLLYCGGATKIRSTAGPFRRIEVRGRNLFRDKGDEELQTAAFSKSVQIPLGLIRNGMWGVDT